MGFSSRRLAAAAAARVPGHPFFFSVGECSVCVLSLCAVARWAWPSSFPLHPPPSPAHAQAAWPDRPVRVIVPFPASGATDLVARVVTQRVAADLGQQMVVDNK